MFNRLDFLSQKIEVVIISTKEKYYDNLGSKTCNPQTHCKTYWSLLKTLVNGRRVPLISPIETGNKFITNFTEKAKAFNGYFVRQCRVIDNNNQLSNYANFCTNERLSKIKFTSKDILKIQKNLDINKVHGDDNLSIRIIELGSDSVCKPQELIFRDCLKEGRFHFSLEKGKYSSYLQKE